MQQDIVDNAILDFIKEEALHGRLESTAPEITRGLSKHRYSYNDVIKALERLTTRGSVEYRVRGSERKRVPYYYLAEIKNLCHNVWGK